MAAEGRGHRRWIALAASLVLAACAGSDRRGPIPAHHVVRAGETLYSIALRYVRDETAAPIVIAKGQDLVALKIREIAEAHDIPVFEDVALARSMYNQVSVDNMIPSQFYQAVAELVRVLYANKSAPDAGRVTP